MLWIVQDGILVNCPSLVSGTHVFSYYLPSAVALLKEVLFKLYCFDVSLQIKKKLF